MLLDIILWSFFVTSYWYTIGVAINSFVDRKRVKLNVFETILFVIAVSVPPIMLTAAMIYFIDDSVKAMRRRRVSRAAQDIAEGFEKLDAAAKKDTGI